MPPTLGLLGCGLAASLRPPGALKPVLTLTNTSGTAACVCAALDEIKAAD
jgi:hypothetical protein